MYQRFRPGPARALGLPSFLVVLLAATVATAASPWWVEVAPSRLAVAEAEDFTQTYRTYQIDASAFRSALSAAPKSYTGDPGIAFALPTPDGDTVRLRVVEDTILSPEMAQRRPDARFYAGVGIDDPRVNARFGITDQGVHARVRTPDGAWNLDNVRQAGPDIALAWFDSDRAPSGATCGVDESLELVPVEDLPPSGLDRRLGEFLRTYRWAMNATGEFTQEASSASQVETVMMTLTNTMNGLYINEFAVRFELVEMNVYTDPATDPFSDGTTLNSTLLQQSTIALNSVVGSNNYDVGHVLSTVPGNAQGGLAFVGQQCGSLKGGGGTLMGSSTAGSVYPIMIHEVGHQLGASHSFNSMNAGCSGNRSSSWAYEIGSGVTIMSYAGLCGSENVQGDDIDIFNAGSHLQIRNRLSQTSSCGSIESTGNSAPVVSGLPDVTIPRETAFELTAVASDADDDVMTYAWEQYDLGAATPPIDPSSGPAFRNFGPSASPSRSFPFYTFYRSGSSTPWEFLPTVDRTMNFRVVVRDNNPAGGGVTYGAQTVVVSGDPFRVLGPNGGETFEAGTDITVTWNAGGTQDADVRILLSTDDGLTWNEAVASTPNDGEATIQSPCEVTTMARVRIEGTVNPWFDISDQEFTTTAETTPPVIDCPTTFLITTENPDGITSSDPAIQDLIDAISATDNCDGDVTPNVIVPATLPIGDTVVPTTATDAASNLSVCTTTVTVELDDVTDAPSFDRTRTGFVAISPNPFNPRTTIEFNLRGAQDVRLDVFDTRGRRVDTLIEGTRGAGAHEVVWNGVDADGRGIPSGVYFLRLTTDEGTFAERAVLLK